MRNSILSIVVLVFSPSLVSGGPLLDAIDGTQTIGPASRAIALWSDDGDVFTVNTLAGGLVVVRLEQPPKPEKKPGIDLSTGRALGPDVGCGSSTCEMCVLNALAGHGQSYEFLTTLSHAERMRLHYRLHRGEAGVKGKTQYVGGSGGGRRGFFRRR